MTLRQHPHLYEINTLPWLNSLSARFGRQVTLGSVPDDRWDALRELGIDLVYLMGIWRRSAISRQIARGESALFDAYERALPGWRAKDVAGSAFSIAAYEPDQAVGTWDDVDTVREKFHARGMRLIVDFVVNHTAFDHVWVAEHPDRYVNVPETVFRRDRAAARIVETRSGEVRFIACGRDPYFPPWDDVAQINHFSGDARAALIRELRTIAQHADGARCDMAMLALSDVFERTWASAVRAPRPAEEFWTEARAAVPRFILLAEVYWDLEWRLQQLGFDFTYDKKFYDRLLHGPARDVRDHLRAEDDYQNRSTRFIENHDEERSVAAFGDRVRAAAVAMSTVRGMRFYHDGQFEGLRARVPVQLGFAAQGPDDNALADFYRRLLAVVDAEPFHAGEWRPLETIAAGDGTHEQIVAWRWAHGTSVYVVVANLGDGAAQGHVQLNAELPAGASAFVFHDVLNDRTFPWSRDALDAAGGLYVRLERGDAHLFRLE